MIRLVSLVLIICSSCQITAEQEGTIAKTISAKELQVLIKDKADLQLIDVRTDREYKAGHLPKSVLIDYYKPDFKTQLAKLDKNKPIAVYCAVGGRSGSALKLLKTMGFKEAYDLAGGIRDWQKQKLIIDH